MIPNQKKLKQKSVSYMEAVAWIANNDDPTTTDLDTICGMLTVVLIADLFGYSEKKVALDVLSYRRSDML